MKLQIRRFNLIEILFAIILLAFGVVVLLGMLPSGLRATSDAATQAYSGEIVDQIAEYVYKRYRDNDSGSGFTVCTDTEATQTFLSSFSEDKTIREDYEKLLKCNNDAAETLPSGYERTGTNGVYAYGNSGTFVLVMGDSFKNGTIDDNGKELFEHRLDFSALIRVWKSPHQIESLRIDHKITGDHDCRTAGCFSSTPKHDFCNAQGCQYNVEISWPLTKEYQKRNKSYYTIDAHAEEQTTTTP